MKLLSWNCNGLGNPLSVKALQDWCWRDRSEMVFVMETKMDSQRLELIRNRCSFTSGVCFSSNRRSGGMGLWWRDVTVNVCSFSNHHVEVDVCDGNNIAIWKAVGVYGWPEATNKHLTWDLMRSIRHGSALPMLLFGDFNEILGMHEKEGGAIRGERQIDAFREAVEECGCRDLGYRGNIFTWQRGKSIDTVIRERLDRCMADINWCNLFPYAEVIHFPICQSDHGAILLKFGDKPERRQQGKLFRFEALWLSSEDCSKVFGDVWLQTLSPLGPRKLLVMCVREFKETERKLKAKQGGQLDAHLMQRCNKLSTELCDLRKLEESYWHARARANELQDGDKNTSYFYHKATQRRKRNLLKGLFNEQGEWKEDKEDMDLIIDQYFSKLFASENSSGFEEAMEGLEELMFWGTIGSDVIQFVKAWWRGDVDLKESAFVPKRLDTDNALVAFEIFHALKRRGDGKDGTVALKLDMSKAYDRVEWGFLEKVMLKMGFSRSWYNGSISGSLSPIRGLRQGDPISPYLFLMCTDAFSRLITKAASENKIHGAYVFWGAPRVSHLFYADDSILFAKANLQECSKVANTIRTYERASGQKVNLSKTEVAFSKCVNLERRKEIVETLGVKEVEKHEKYLGLPTIIGRSKKVVFMCLKERIWKKMQGWKEKLLSRPGKEVLIKAVAQAIPTYMMSIFKIPEGLIDEMHSVLAKFWWGSTATSRKIHCHNWESLCLPKAMGGMGFRDLKCFNQALLAKQGWRLCQDTSTLLHGVLKARYFKHAAFLEAMRGFDPSYSWRSIWGAKSLLLEGFKWRVGNDVEHGGRKEDMVNETFGVEERQTVLDIPLPSTWKCDTQYWWPTNDGNYTVRSGYWLGRMGHVHTWDLFFGRRERDIWKLVWKITGPPKLCHFIWRACKGRLGVMDVLYRRHIREHSTCPVCGCEEETIMHALFNCTYASKIWLHSNFQGMLMEALHTSFAERFMWLAGRLDSEELASFGALVWAAWFCRNRRVFEGDAGLNAVATAAGFVKLKVDYGLYKDKVRGLSSSPTLVVVSSWQPPPQSYVKVNVDAHVMHGNGVSMG
ncbi:uncharacterized protein LOC125498516 [Beta vulgaris subsp. vulgaris]|uniref:uncharacterized protein LOC125498516 n=1 Tax=Beta vulgaris subsp. vulgaris TaxID=3555 RepID=UPI002546C05F|nr:uncharacterized protein LOC125498516 [Beta vulgaris subsp. vulgaris]